MISLIISIILGVIFTAIALQNPTVVDISLFGTSLNLPLYLIGAAAFLAGIFISSFFSLFESTSSAIDLRNRDNKINSLSKSIYELQVENQKLKNQLYNSGRNLQEEKTHSVRSGVRSFFDRFRHRLSI